MYYLHQLRKLNLQQELFPSRAWNATLKHNCLGHHILTPSLQYLIQIDLYQNHQAKELFLSIYDQTHEYSSTNMMSMPLSELPFVVMVL